MTKKKSKLSAMKGLSGEQLDAVSGGSTTENKNQLTELYQNSIPETDDTQETEDSSEISAHIESRTLPILDRLMERHERTHSLGLGLGQLRDTNDYERSHDSEETMSRRLETLQHIRDLDDFRRSHESKDFNPDALETFLRSREPENIEQSHEPNDSQSHAPQYSGIFLPPPLSPPGALTSDILESQVLEIQRQISNSIRDQMIASLSSNGLLKE